MSQYLPWLDLGAELVPILNFNVSVQHKIPSITKESVANRGDVLAKPKAGNQDNCLLPLVSLDEKTTRVCRTLEVV